MSDRSTSALLSLGPEDLPLSSLLIETAEPMFVSVERNLRLVNQKFAETFGYSEAELTRPGFDVNQLIGEESRELLAIRVQHAKEGMPLPARYEFAALRRNGEHFDAEASVNYRHHQGQLITIGVIRDISGRKGMERTLLRKNHELTVLDAVGRAMIEHRALHQILQDVVEQLTVLLEVDAAGISILDEGTIRFSEVHYRGASETFTREMRTRTATSGVLGRALQTKERQIINDINDDPRIRHGAAAREGFRSAVALPLVDQRPLGVVSVFSRTPRDFGTEDISLFEEVARRIARALHNAQVAENAQAELDRTKALAEMARALGSTLDVEGVFKVLGQHLIRFVPYQQLDLFSVRRSSQVSLGVRTIERPALGDPVQVRMADTVLLEDNPSLKVSMETKNPVVRERELYIPLEADEALMGVLRVSLTEAKKLTAWDLELLQDLSIHLALALGNARVYQELRQAYQERQEAQEKLLRSEKLSSLGEMAAGVAHDFNNVLSAILGRAQMLKTMLTNDAVLRSLRIIETAALDGAGTVRRIQEFAKEKSEGDFVRIRFNSLVSETVELCMPRVQEAKEVNLVVELGEVAAIRGMPSELREVFTNLIFNAIDAMPKGGQLAVRTGSGGGEVWVEVADSGVGMSEEVQTRIFDPFFTTKGLRGNGLGLSVSYGIVQRHHGTIDVESKPGKGTCLRVCLPAVPEANSQASEPAPEASENALAIEPQNSGGKILVIDDEGAVREVLADILKSASYQVIVADSGEQGLALFDSENPDVVFTDLGMPNMDGWQVAEEIKKRRADTPIGLITGWGAELEAQSATAENVDLILAKPFRVDAVIKCARQAMGMLGERS